MARYVKEVLDMLRRSLAMSGFRLYAPVLALKWRPAAECRL
jgi:hypothetical protein